MPAGDALAADNQWQIDTVLLGSGNGGVWLQYGQTIEGLGTPDTKTADTPLYGRDGAHAGTDFYEVRIVTIPAMLRGTAATVMTNLRALTETTWAKRAADVSLAFQIAGEQFYVNGRPRGAKTDLTNIKFGLALALLRFDALDPTIFAVA